MSIQSSYKSCSDGYKQTEIGVIPKDWELITYGDAFNFLSTATYSRADLSIDDKVKYVHYGDIHTRFQHILNCEVNLPTVSLEQSKRYSLVECGDIIMADASEDYEGVGKSVEVVNSNSQKVISGLHTFLFRDKKEYFADGFKAYISENPFVKNSFQRLATGMKVFGVSKKNLKTIIIPKPTLEEQKAIANTLSDTDQLIQNLKTLIAKKKAIKQGAMQELLTGKKRLQGFTEEWEIKTIGDIGRVKMCKRIFSFQTDDEGDVPFYKIGTFGKEADSFISKKLFEDFKNKYPYPKNGEILISASGTIGRTVVYNGETTYYQDSNIVWIENDESLVTNQFLYYIYKSIKFNTEGSTIKRLYNNLLLSISFLCPSLKEQQAIAQILSDMDAEIEALEQQLQKTQTLKQGMMQELLTGKIRLVKPATQEKIEPLSMVAEDREKYK